MNYRNSFQEVRLGHVVKTSSHKDAEKQIIKRIDSDSEQVYLVPLYDTKYGGQWYSANALIYIG